MPDEAARTESTNSVNRSGQGERRIGKRAEQKRRWDHENRHVCGCGRPMKRGASMCVTCREEYTRERHAEIVAMRAEGMRNAEIAAELGTTMYAVATIICRLRKRGIEVAPAKLGRPPGARDV
ncbi:MAG: helix-turn-helix domain-containing protein [Patescibacteria group bacterium]|nr:helix-turn-helix domain-containing protein [Patescibacteria group bacterium]